jgi:hypothetical protein
MRLLLFTLGVIAILDMPLAWAGNVNSVRDLPDEIKTSHHGRLSLSDITLLDVSIGRETLDNIRSRFGPAKSFRETKNSVSADDEICYSSENPSDETRIIYGSGPMGGWSRVTQFQVLSRISLKSPCTPSARVTHTIATQSGIRLGMPLKELSAKLGIPTQQGEGFVIYSFEQKSDYPKRSDFDMLSGVGASIANGRVTSFRVFLIESN